MGEHILKRINQIYKIFKNNNWYYSKLNSTELISDYELRKLLDQKKIVKMKSGLYRWTNVQSQGQNQIIEISYIAPMGVFCLSSALYLHDLTSYVSPSFYIAFPRNSRIPIDLMEKPVIPKKWKSPYFDLGIDLKSIGDYQIRVYNLEKTICDIVRFRKEIGFEILKEAIKNYWYSKRKNKFKLMQYAKALNVKEKLLNYVYMLD